MAFRNPDLPLDRRIDDLLERMTLSEKISLLHQYQPAIPRLGMPLFKMGTEALHGVAWSNDFNQKGAVVFAKGTVFPQAIGLASTWNPELVRRVGRAVGLEARGFHAQNPIVWGLNLWAPVVNLLRDPRWGRNEEGYSEDPYLTGQMATAYGRGMQGDDPRYLLAAPTLKHYLAYNNEVDRATSNSSVPPRILHDYDERAFRIPLASGAANAVMPSYNLVNGRPNTVNPDLGRLLRAWAPKDIAVVSDAGAPTNLVTSEAYYATRPEAYAAGVKAGLDSFTDNDTDGSIVAGAIQSAIDQGLLTVAEVEEVDRHLLSIRFRLGEFDADNPYAGITPAVIDTPEHRALARTAADEQIVLLRNEGGLLPLDVGSIKRLAVVGPLARVLYQDWYGGTMPYRITPLQGITERLGTHGEVVSTEGVDRIALKDVATGKYLTADPAGGKLHGGATAAGDDESFDVFDWGAGICTLRTVANGKYLSLGDGRTLVNDAEQPNGWFVQQQLKLDAQPDGSYVLEYAGNDARQSWFGPNKFAVLGSDGTLTIGAKSPAEATKFSREVLRSGMDSAVSAAAGADAAVVVVGSMPFINGREDADRTSTELAPAQRALIEAVQKSHPHTIVVVENSYPTTGWDKQRVPAILWTTHAGQETGHAIADVLFGQHNPSGRLTQTWYASDAELPSLLEYDISKSEMTYQYFRGKSLFPFGYGLSYTSFDCGKLRVDRLWTTAEGQVELSVDVRNTGRRAGVEVVQLYSKAQHSSKGGPIQELRGFQRVALLPGETKTVKLSLNAKDLAFWDVSRGKSVVETGSYRLLVGSSATDIHDSVSVFVAGETIPPRNSNATMLAESFDDDQRITLVDQSKADGTSAQGSDGSWLGYHRVAFSPSARALVATVARPESGEAHITVRIDDPIHGPTLGTLTVPSTGDRYRYIDVSASLRPMAGVHDVYLVFDGAIILHSFRL